MDTRPSPAQAESEQRWRLQELTASEQSESDLFSGSENKSEISSQTDTVTENKTGFVRGNHVNA